MASPSRVGCTRFVKTVTYKFCAGSIHSDVPVKPVCPIASGDIFVPQDDVGSIVSHARARELCGTVVFAAKSCSEGERIHHRAHAPTAAAVPNSPACEATPPSAAAFSSC